MVDEIVNIENTIQGEVCFSSAICQTLFNYGILLSEEVLFGLGIGLQFRFNVKDDKTGVCIDCMNLLSDFNSIRQFLNSIGVDISFCSFTNTEKFREQLINIKKEKNFFIVAVDSYNLKYSPTYLKKHDAHVLVGQVKDTDVLIQDNYVYTLIPSKRICLVGFEEFIKICDLSSLESPYNHMFWTFDIKHNTNIHLDLKYIDNCIYKSGLQMMGKVYEDSMWQGIDGLTKFNEYVLTLMGNRDDSIWKDFKELNEKISARGGLYQSRKLFSKFMNWLHINYDLPFLSLSEDYNLLSHKWKVFSTMLLKASIRKNSDDFDLMKQRLAENIEMEKKHITKLINERS